MIDQYIPREELVEISLLSVLNVSVFITIVLVVMSLFLKKGRLVRKVGPSCIIYLLMALIIRMFIPVRFSIAKEIYVLDILTPSFMALNYSIKIGGVLVIKVYQILLFIWILGAGISIFFKLISYKKIRRYTNILPISNADGIKEILGINCCSNLLDNVKIAYSNEVASPYLIGFFKPLIVLPMMEYTDEQLKYVVTHELMHAKNKDVFWKILADILCTVFWWNPIFNFLRDQLFKMIEIRNDREIIKDYNDYEILGYMECLMNTAINLSGKDVLFSVSFTKNDYEELRLRMGLVSENRKYARAPQVILSLIISLVIILTSFFEVEPASFPKEEELDGGVILSEENTFLIKSKCGYEVYVYDEFLTIISDLRPFEGVPIYESLEEALND